MARRERRDSRAHHAIASSAREDRGRVVGAWGARVCAGAGRWLVMAIVVVGVAACSRAGRGANGPDAERQSESEYDVARDLFIRSRDPRGALAHAEKAVELNDQNAEAHHFVALIYLNFCAASPLECRLPEAERAARRAVEIKPDFREAKNTLGVVLIQAKKYADAIAVLEPLANDMLYQTPWVAWGNLGQAYLESGKADQAIAALRRSIAAEPRFCVGNFRLGLAFEKKGDLAAAREAFSRALETNRPECQSLQDAFEARARVYSKSKNCDLAKGDWEKCKEISADSPAGQRCVASLKSSPC